MIVIVSVVVRQGIGALHQARLSAASKQALFAAEAGAADAFRRLVEDPAWNGPIPETTTPGGSSYEVGITNNLGGGAVVSAPNGAQVPPGFAYILAVGRPGPQGVTRRVGVLVSPGSVTALSIAIGAGGQVDMQGGKTIHGSIRANGNIALQGSTTIVPINSSGRLLSSGDISTQGSTRMDEAQDVRARGTVSSSPTINGPYLVQSADTSDSTLPFINDYRTTNALNPGDQGVVLPNPDSDPAGPLLTGAALHNPTCVVSNFDTAAPCVNGHAPTPPSQVHHFPFAVTFGGSSNITGGGTIVVTGGNPMIFGSCDVDANLIVLRDLAQQATNAGDPSITFQGSSTVRGLVYAHQDIRFQGSSNVQGLLIAYKGDIETQGSSDIRLDSTVLSDIPGFSGWSAGFGGDGGIPAGSGPVSIRSWERQ